MVRTCVLRCKDGESLYAFPNKEKDAERRKQWLKFFNLKDNDTKNLYACSLHFSAIEKEIGRKFMVPDLINSREHEADDSMPMQDVKLEDYSHTNAEPILTLSFKMDACSQTNSRLCGTVQIAETLDEYHLNCFYCCDTFPLEKWYEFTDHLNNRHFEEEQAFKNTKYTCDDHDYATVSPVLMPELEPSSSPDQSLNESSSLLMPASSSNIPKSATKTKPTLKKYARKKKSKKILPKQMSSPLCYIKENNIVTKKQTPIQTALKRCLTRSQTDLNEPLSTTPSLNPTELVFELTPREIILDLLENIKEHTILWKFHGEPNNRVYAKAIKELCKIINEKWSLNVTMLQMRRSINRILHFYRFMLHCDKVDIFKEYFDKCSEFLPSNVDDIPPARCEYCDYCFVTTTTMLKHIKEEHGSLNWPYKCDYCLERFMKNDEYEVHKHLPHYVEIFRCQDCDETFYSRYILSRHKVIHEPAVPVEPGLPAVHKCDVCDKGFKSRSELSNHKVYHKEKQFKCHLCEKSYYQSLDLSHHLKLHRNERNFICEFCAKAFITPIRLKEHLETHTGEKITCNICNLKLRRTNLHRHLRLVHVAYEGTIESTFRAKSYRYKRYRGLKSTGRTKETGPRKYFCKICKIDFDRLKVLKDHNKDVHSDVQVIYRCKICDAELKYKMNLKRHYIDKHKLHWVQVLKILDHNMEPEEALKLDVNQLTHITEADWISVNNIDQPPMDHTDEQKCENETNEVMEFETVENIDIDDIKIDTEEQMNDFIQSF